MATVRIPFLEAVTEYEILVYFPLSSGLISAKSENFSTYHRSFDEIPESMFTSRPFLDRTWGGEVFLKWLPKLGRGVGVYKTLEAEIMLVLLDENLQVIRHEVCKMWWWWWWW